MELSCFFHDPADVGNLISGFSAFSKTSLNIWKFTVHVLLKPGLVQFSGSVVSDSLRPHEPQHARPPCPSPTPGVQPSPCQSSQWCHLTISSCRPLLLMPSVFNSIRVFSNESALCIRWPKYWSFSFNISPSNEHPGLISFRMDWLDLFAVQGTLTSLFQHHSSKASIFGAQFSSQSNSHIHTWPLEKP